jgi:hypothetical protein
MISLGIAAGAAVLFPIGWRLLRGEEVVAPFQRTWGEWQTRWRCEAGHFFYAPGQAGARMCVQTDCDQPAFPVAQYACPHPKHGPFEVNVLFSEGEDGRPVISRLRLIGGPWVSASDGLYCPRCGRRLRYTGDPLMGSVGGRDRND